MKHSNKKFTIIVAMYNVEKYIDKALKSCVDQTYKDIEILIINDGSTDHSSGIAQKYVDQYDNVTMITTENRGLSMARNEGVSRAIGDYLLFLDGDDWLEANAIETCANALKEELEVFFFNAKDCYDNDENITSVAEQVKYNLVDRICTGAEIVENYKNHLIQIESWRGCYQKSFLDRYDIRFVPKVFWEDTSFWFQIILKAKTVMYGNQYLYNYRIRNGSIMKSPADYEKMKSVFVLHEVMLEELESVKTEVSYVVACSYVLIGLMKACGKQICTDYLPMLKNYRDEILKRKEELLSKIDLIYCNISIPDVLKIKYQLYCMLVFFAGVYEEEMLFQIERLREQNISVLKKNMISWPLQEDKKVGIYGSGRNADVILNTYKKIIGEIKANYCYIDSQKESFTSKHLNKDVIHVADVADNHIEEVIICSNMYEDEMAQTLYSYYDDISVFRVYEDDKVNIEEILSENYYELLKRLLHKTKPRVLLIGTPEYPNIGDHLIVLGEEQFLHDYMSEYEIVEITNQQYSLYKSCLYNVIDKDDIIAITGGGFLGSLWTDALYDEVLDIVKGYPENRIMIFPQSVYFEENILGDKYLKATQEVFGGHPNLEICVREAYSYRRLKDILIDSKQIHLFPDMALYYKTDVDRVQRSEKIGVYLRRDKESILSMEQKNAIIQVLDSMGTIERFSMQYTTFILPDDRLQAVTEKLSEISNYKLVITDALHCMIACALTRTPCIAINNISLKVEGVFEWIKGIGNIQLFDPQKSDLGECIHTVLATSYNEKTFLSLEEYWKQLSKTLKKKYHSVALCGYRQRGKKRYKELLATGIQVPYIIERNYQALSVWESDMECEIVGFQMPLDYYRQADAILLTGDLPEATIRETLELAKIDVPIIVDIEV